MNPEIPNDLDSVKPGPSPEGCSCRVDGETSYGNLIWLLAAFGLLLFGWRRRA